MMIFIFVVIIISKEKTTINKSIQKVRKQREEKGLLVEIALNVVLS
jgi:hypothetical protein